MQHLQYQETPSTVGSLWHLDAARVCIPAALSALSISPEHGELYWYSNISNKCSSVWAQQKMEEESYKPLWGLSRPVARLGWARALRPRRWWIRRSCGAGAGACSRVAPATAIFQQLDTRTRKQECELLMGAPRETLRRCAHANQNQIYSRRPRRTQRDEIIKAFISGMRDVRRSNTHGQPASTHHQSTNWRLSNFGLSI
jgi:hypothetical protein